MKILKSILIILIFPLAVFSQASENIRAGNEIIHLITYGKGTPVLIINGGPGMNSEGFGSLAKKIGETNRAIIYDQRGTGQSTIPVIDSTTITMDLMVMDIETIRKHLGIKQWVVLGHSFGGMLASYYTSKFPERVRGLILSSSGGIDMELFSGFNPSSKLSQADRDSLNYWTRKVAEGDTSHYAKYQKGKYLAPLYLYDQSFVPDIAERLTQVNLTVNGLVFHNLQKIKFNSAPSLEHFQKPVLILQGEEDIVPVEISEKAHRVLKNSSLVIIEDCGHYGWLEQPGKYFKYIDDFLKGITGGNG